VRGTLLSGVPSTISRLVMVFAAVTAVMGGVASPDCSLAEEKQGDKLNAKQPKQKTHAIEVFVDLSLGLCDEQAAKKKLAALEIESKNFEAALDRELDELRSDLVGIRQVSGKQFAALTRSMDIISSGSSISPLGVSRDRAYLEVNVYLTSRHRYVAVVTTKLAGLPEEVVRKLSGEELDRGR